MMPESIGKQFVDSLNKDCHCISVDRRALHDGLQAHLRDSGLPDPMLDTHRHLFADAPVFLWQGHIHAMEEVIRAVERVSENRSYRESVLAAVPANARQAFGPKGVFFGYDFHLGANGPRLIEINTNAGGALLNFYLAAAQQACCSEVATLFGDIADFADLENELIRMFRLELQLQRPGHALTTVAIVDKSPADQFLFPEFLLFRSLFDRHGIEAVIADPRELSLHDGSLWVGKRKIDLVYNRLTDFYLQEPGSAPLLDAYRQGLAVVTPSPHHYAMFADKRNLALLSDARRLEEFGVDRESIHTLSEFVPSTVVVTADNSARLWKERKQFFFKPLTGHGSRGAYRGAKLTRRVWENIVQSGYVAQALVVPSERRLNVNGEVRALKLDIRCVTYDGRVRSLSARLYQGQTTNLRTEGGGLATVFAMPACPEPAAPGRCTYD